MLKIRSDLDLQLESSPCVYYDGIMLLSFKVENVKQALKTQGMSLTQDIDIDSTMQQRSVHKLKG